MCKVLLLRLVVLQKEVKGQRSCELAELFAVVCLAEIMFSGAPRTCCHRWVKGGSGDECLYLYMCAWETERKAVKTYKIDSTFLMHFWALTICCLHQTSAKRIWTSHTDRCINVFVRLVVKLHQPKQYAELRQREIKIDSKREEQIGLFSIWNTNAPRYWKCLKPQTFFMEIREINSTINH